MSNSWWVRLIAYVPGSVNQELLLRNEYLAAENRILRANLPTRMRLGDPEAHSLRCRSAPLPEVAGTRSRLGRTGGRLDAGYDLHEEIEGMAITGSRREGSVVPVREVAGQEIHQAYVGSLGQTGTGSVARDTPRAGGSQALILRP